MKLIKEANDFDSIGVHTPFLFKDRNTDMVYIMELHGTSTRLYFNPNQQLKSGTRPFVGNPEYTKSENNYWYFTIEKIKELFSANKLVVVFE